MITVVTTASKPTVRSWFDPGTSDSGLVVLATTVLASSLSKTKEFLYKTLIFEILQFV